MTSWFCVSISFHCNSFDDKYMAVELYVIVSAFGCCSYEYHCHTIFAMYSIVWAFALRHNILSSVKTLFFDSIALFFQDVINSFYIVLAKDIKRINVGAFHQNAFYWTNILSWFDFRSDKSQTFQRFQSLPHRREKCPIRIICRNKLSTLIDIWVFERPLTSNYVFK